jgi:hypothetical protein
MANVKSALECLEVDVSERVSVLGDLFGFLRRKVPNDNPATKSRVSLLQQIQSIQGPHFHFNIIRVGFDLLPTSAAECSSLDECYEKLDYAVYRSREIFQQIEVGLGRVLHYAISSSDAAGKDDLGSLGEGEELIEQWSTDNNGIDLFFVRTISDTSTNWAGMTPDVPGSCDKGDKDDGLIGGEINRTFEQVARTLAHEVGHFCGLEHNHADNACPTTAGCDRLMMQTVCLVDPACIGVASLVNSTVLNNAEGETIRGSCPMQVGC